MDIATVIGFVGTMGLIAWAMDSAAGIWCLHRHFIRSYRIRRVDHGLVDEIYPP